MMYNSLSAGTYVNMMLNSQQQQQQSKTGKSLWVKYLTFSLFLVGALLNFLPLLLGLSFKDPSTNSYPDYFHSLSSFGHSVSLVAGISANIFILIDYIFDYCLRRIGFYSHSPAQKGAVPAVYVPLRESIVYLLVPDLLILFWLIPYEHYEGMIVLVDARDTMYVYSILTCVTNFSNPVWTWKAVLVIGIPFMISNLLQSFKIFLDSFLSAVLLYIFTSLGLFSYAVYVWWWVRHVANMKVDDISGTDTILCSAYVLFFGIFLLGNWVAAYLPTHEGDPWSSDAGVAYFTLYEYLMAGCTLCMTVMSSCCAKLAAAESKVGNLPYLRIV